MMDILEKYSVDVLKNLNKNNMVEIVHFLESQNCDFIEDILEDYLDLFTMEYNGFINKYNKLNKKYDFNLLKKASEDMNILEEFFED